MAMNETSNVDRWENIKASFVQLYLNENKKLELVAQILRENHDFHASKASYKRQIRIWGTRKNLNASEKEGLAIQTKAGYRPTHDINGRPIPWNRVYRSTRGKNELPCRGRLSAFRVQMRPAILQPRPTSLDQDSVIIRLWQDIWRHSTHSYASQDPATEEYQIQHRLYRQTMCSITAITSSSRAEWSLGHRVCDAIIELLNSQPAMVCDLLLSLIHNNVCQTVGKRALIDAIFRYICKAANNLPEYAPFRRFVLRLDDQASLSRLGSAMAKAKVDTMWMTRVPSVAINQRKRDFFKEVIVYAINIVMDYGEHGFAKEYLDLLLLNNPGDEMLAGTYTRLQQVRSTGDLSVELSLANSSSREGSTQSHRNKQVVVPCMEQMS